MNKNAPLVVIDYGLGNLFSIGRALSHLGAEATVTSDARAVASAGKLILPGVGAFGDGMRGLLENGLVDPIKAHAAAGRPLLGICLGMQLLMDEGNEFGVHKGLGLVPGSAVAFPRPNGARFKIPHVGWNRLRPPARKPPEQAWAGTILAGLGAEPYAYFVHSFVVAPKDRSACLAETVYGGSAFCSVIRSGSVSGCQFHPEKSGRAGLDILRNFLEA